MEIMSKNYYKMSENGDFAKCPRMVIILLLIGLSIGAKIADL